MADQIEIEILEDGTVKVITPKIGAANHANADKLMSILAEYMGGDVEEEKLGHGHTHQSRDQRINQ